MVYSQRSLRRSLSALRRDSKSAAGPAANKEAARNVVRATQRSDRSMVPPGMFEGIVTGTKGYIVAFCDGVRATLWLETFVQFLQQLRVVMYRALENFGLLLRCGPVLFLDCFGQAGEFQMRVRESGAVENVFEPRAAGDAIGGEPGAFALP